MNRWVLIGAALLLLSGCSNNDSPPGGDAAAGGDRSAASGDKKVDSPWGNVQVGCANLGVMACGDGKDNDGDGLIDAEDPECSGPCDNDEGSFATGIPGDNMDACKQDCFFDGNSGSGDDKCEWNLKCDPKSPGANLAKACPYDPNASCPTDQVQGCKDYCLTRTPNGCDCFGCCQVFLERQVLHGLSRARARPARPRRRRTAPPARRSPPASTTAPSASSAWARPSRTCPPSASRPGPTVARARSTRDRSCRNARAGCSPASTTPAARSATSA